MLKRLFGAMAAIAMAASPATARIEEGTKPLLELIANSGIALRYNSADCKSGEFLGLYRHRGMQRALILCPGEDVTALDHKVVRHETIHAIQHCVNVARGTGLFTPVIEDSDELMAWVLNYLTPEELDNIKRVYPVEHWAIEFEAFAGMEAFTADELAEMFRQACLYSDE